MKLWWTAHSGKIKKVATRLSGLASVVGLAYKFVPNIASWSWWMYLLLMAAVVASLLGILLDLQSERGSRYFRHDDGGGIRKYMHEWIKHGGRVAIVSSPVK